VKVGSWCINPKTAAAAGKQAFKPSLAAGFPTREQLVEALGLVEDIIAETNSQQPAEAPSDFPARVAAAWESFQEDFGKTYDGLEQGARFEVFARNFARIEAHNARQNSYKLGVNQFTDLTADEFHALKGKRRPVVAIEESDVDFSATAPAPAIDWRTKNAVAPIKNQLGCGCDYAFAAVAAIEGVHAISSGSLAILSEQQIVDCSEPQGNQGCQGGGVDNSFTFVTSNGGIGTEVTYPFVGEQGVCQTNVTSIATIKSVVNLASGDETALLSAVNLNPVVAYVDSSQEAFQFYSMGILNDPTCGTAVDHAVLVVGYATDAKTSTNYWIIKNSWGPVWGLQGYALLKRDINQCGISTRMMYPVA
jgi:cathepsin L